MIPLRFVCGVTVFLLLLANCATPPVVRPSPVLAVYIDDTTISWDEPQHFDLMPDDVYVIFYGRDLSSPEISSDTNVKKSMHRQDERRSASLQPFDDTGNYTAVVGVLRQGQLVLSSRPITVYLQAPPPPPPAPIRRIEVRLQASTILFTAYGSFPLGFMVVWSKNPAPVFPTRAGDLSLYRGPNDPREVRLQPFDGPGEYYVRVFEFLGDEQTGIVSETLRAVLP